jgi:hypothetical protein
MNRFFPNYPDYLVTSKFGMRTHPVTKVKAMHNGIDMTATKDGIVGHTDYIMTHTGGTVAAVGYDNISGNYVKIQVDPATIMVYYHLQDRSTLQKGQKVKKGDIIGYMGNTGRAAGKHLHWGIQKDGKWIDPAPYLDKDYPVQTTKYVTVDLPVLKRGSKDDTVEAMQGLLLGYGYNLGSKGIDGSFGPATERALKEYQAKNGLAVDGSCGRKTWNSLLNLE